MSHEGFWCGRLNSVWSWCGRQELMTLTGSMVTPGLLCPVTVASAKFIFVLFTYLYSTLTSACSSPALVPRVAMTPESFHPIAWAWCCTRSARPCSVLPFWTCLRPSLLLSSLSLAIMCCFLGYGPQIELLLCCRGMYQLVLWGRRVCIKLQMISPEQAGPGDWRKNICVISLQLTTGMSSLPSSMCSGCHQQLSLGHNLGR